MYSDMNNNQNEENDTRQESAMDKALSFLPSAKVLGIIVLIEVLVFAGVMYFKNKDEDSSTTTISLENNPEYVLVNDSRKINFKVNGKTYNGDYSNVTMRLDNSSLASISNGVITTGNVLGSTNITIIYNESMGTGRLIVYMGDKNVNTTDVNIPEGNLAVKVSSSYDIFKSISMTPSNGYVEKIEYLSSDTSKVRVDENGKIEGVALGESEVTVVVNNVIRKSFKVVVTDSDENLGFVTETSTTPSEIQEIKFTQPEITTTNNISTLKLTVNDLYKLVPEIVPANATNKALTYDLFDKTIISVTPSADGTSAEIKALKAGTTSITVKSSNGKIGVLTIVVTKSGSNSTTSSGACYCNSSYKCIWNTGGNSEYKTKQSSLPNMTSCGIYSDNHGYACFKDSSGKYTWGRYGNESGYRYVAGIADRKNCESDTKVTSSLTCPSPLVQGSSGSCKITTSNQAKISSVRSSNDKVVRIDSSDTYKINFTCLEVESSKDTYTVATIYAKTSDGIEISQIIQCRNKSKITFSCTPKNPGKGENVTCNVYGLDDSSQLKSCSSDKGTFKKSGTSCVGTYNEEGKVTITAETAFGTKTYDVTFQKGSKKIVADCGGKSVKAGGNISCGMSESTTTKEITCSATGCDCSCSGKTCTVSCKTSGTVTVTFSADDAATATRTVYFTSGTVYNFTPNCPSYTNTTNKSVYCSVNTNAPDWDCSTSTANASCNREGDKCKCEYNGTQNNALVNVKFISTQIISSDGSRTKNASITFNFVGDQH